MPFHPAGVSPAIQAAGLPDYFVFGVIHWHFRHQRPQQLAKVISGTGRRVFYISSNFVADRRGGFAVEQLDEDGRLFQIKLFIDVPPIIYFTAPSAARVEQLRRSLGQVLKWADSSRIVSVVQHPFWLEVTRVLPDSRLVYDCIDHHEGFGNNAKEVLALEQDLFRSADLTVATSARLAGFVASKARRHALIRNGCDFEHFSITPERIYRDPMGRRVIGYYGAIANWLDLDLIAAVAERFPDCCVLLVGADTVGAQLALAHHKNVVFTGEVHYGDLPSYLYGFDVALLPFKVIPLTLATNPVKVYEYLGAGKPVVSVDIPEMHEFEGHVRYAGSTLAFLNAIEETLDEPALPEVIDARREFAGRQTWRSRADMLFAAAESVDLEVAISVVVVTFNNIDFTRSCLASLETNSDCEALEIVVVDNNSSDGTREFLEEWAASKSRRKVIFNDSNRGYAAANNQGLAAASGDYFVLLNNDTYVTRGWVRTLSRHLRNDPTIGLIGPVTNNIGNEARIRIRYENMEEMERAASEYTRSNVGKLVELRTLAFYCVMLPRTAYERVGPLDESFGLGFFEDDDYCRRVERLGLRAVCAHDVFVHHHLSASFLKLDTETRRKLFDTNRALYESKWGKWEPHRPGSDRGFLHRAGVARR